MGHKDDDDVIEFKEAELTDDVLLADDDNAEPDLAALAAEEDNTPDDVFTANDSQRAMDATQIIWVKLVFPLYYPPKKKSIFPVLRSKATKLPVNV